jgi:hypothetical protein
MPDLSLPLFDLPDAVPYRGTTASTRAASASGAAYALEGRGAKLARLRALYAEPRTMQDIARITGWPINTVCSLTGALKKRGEIDEAGSEIHRWPDGRTTTRTQWQIRRS